MRVENIQAEEVEGKLRLSARLVAEGGYRGPDTLWYEVEPAHAGDVEPSADAFLLALAPVAMRWGEPRLRIDAPVCPRLLDGVEELLRVLEHWTPAYPRLPLEPAGGVLVRAPSEGGRVAAFVSGGVDSLAMLRRHRRWFPAGHPDAISDGFFAFGLGSFDFEGNVPVPERVRAWREQRDRLRAFGADVGLSVISVGTNVRTLAPDFAAWTYQTFGPGTLAIAHLFRPRVRRAWIGSNGYGPAQGRYSSHPLIDPLMSSTAVEVTTGEPMRLRHEKLTEVAAWDEALRVLQVCFMHEPPPPGTSNCGRCEKCLRTRMGLVALGRLEAATTFPPGELTAAELARYSPSGDPLGLFSRPLLEGLTRAGRHDLARVLARRIAHAARRARRRASWWGRLGRRLRRAGKARKAGASPTLPPRVGAPSQARR